MLLSLRTTTLATLLFAACTHADDGDDAADVTDGGASGNADDGNPAEDGNADDGNTPAMPLGPSDAQLVPDNLMTCADGFPIQINPTFPQPFTGQGASSCTLLTYSNVQPTTGGTVVSANIGVGPTTGPMRFVRMRILEQPGTGTACCSAEEFGDMFTPDANAVTTVPLGFVFEADTDEETQIRYADWIALEVLAPDVPIPGIWTANGGGDVMLPDYLWLPALSTRSAAPTQNLRSEGSYSGFVPTFNISFVPAP
ncbi:MAG TPA: hypothetical protein VG755_08590 [Nannocystaceae bacterium]|nr:hypothetical protein [Nannocystaceae bacterium]